MSISNTFIYEFGDYRLSPAERKLSHGGRPIALTPKAFDTLLALVERNHELVTKDELMEIVWNDVIVEETGLTRNISVLRKVLDDNDRKSPRFIETVSRFGYRFVAEVTKISGVVGRRLSNSFRPTHLDPDFALAYCGLADVYAHLHLRMALSPSSEHLVKARTWLTKALELDPTIAEAHATLGYFAYFYDWNWERAEVEFERALEISPNDVESHRLYANFLSRKGRFSEACLQIQRALELDSSSFQTLWLKSQIYYREKNFEVAWDIGEKLIEEYGNEPKLYHVYLLFGTSYSIRQQHDVKFALLHKAETLSMRSFDGAKELIGTFGSAYARAGRIEEAQNCLKKLENLSRETDVAYEFATIYANLGEFDRAFEHLGKLVDRRDWRMVHLLAELDLFALHDDEHFHYLLKTIGIRE